MAMTTGVAFYLSLLVVALSHAVTPIDFRLVSSASVCAAQNTLTNCTQTGPGLYCDSCKSVVACKKTGANVWEKDLIKACASSEKCVSGACTTDPNPICDGTACLEFICKNVGVFPDPFFCNRYIMCVNVPSLLKPVLKGYLQTCDEGFGYDIASGVCKTKLVSGKCPAGNYPVPVCTAPGQTAPLKENKSIFYICEQYSSNKQILYPVIDICPNGQTYGNFECK